MLVLAISRRVREEGGLDGIIGSSAKKEAFHARGDRDIEGEDERGEEVKARET